MARYFGATLSAAAQLWAFLFVSPPPDSSEHYILSIVKPQTMATACLVSSEASIRGRCAPMLVSMHHSKSQQYGEVRLTSPRFSGGSMEMFTFLMMHAFCPIGGKERKGTNGILRKYSS